MSDARDDDAQSLPVLLGDLEETLTALRSELAPGGDVVESRPDGRSRFPRPPSPGELLRFTEEYTIPTLIAVLEANVRLLRLVQAGLRAVDPEKSALSGDRRDGLGDEARRAATDAGRASADRLARGLEDLQTALSETDLPEDPEARRLLTDARDLSSEIRERIRATDGESIRSPVDADERAADSGRSRGGLGADAVDIEVRGEDAGDGGDADTGEDAGDGTSDDQADEADVDVDAELESIRQEVGKSESEHGRDDDSGAGRDGAGAGEDADDVERADGVDSVGDGDDGDGQAGNDGGEAADEGDDGAGAQRSGSRDE